MKQCAYCGETKPLVEFRVSKRIKCGRTNQCKKCYGEYLRAYYKNNLKGKEKRIRSQRNSSYRLQGMTNSSGTPFTLDDYNKLAEQQDNRCGICGSQPKTLHADHHHTTGIVRGLLCGKCNNTLGLVQENKSILQNMINYLDKSTVDGVKWVDDPQYQ